MRKIRSVPILVLVAFLPVITIFHIEMIEFSKYPWFPNQGYWFDVFLYGKSRLVQIAAFFMAIVLIAFKFRKKQKIFLKENLLWLILIFFLGMSAVFSRYPVESFCGSIEQYESIGVLFSYIVIVLYCSNFFDERKQCYFLQKALVFGLILSCVLGILQLFQYDFWNSEFGRKILIPDSYETLRGSLRFSKDSEGFGRVYMGLYNSSYAGIYLVMLLPFFILSEKRWMKCLSVPVIACLIGTMSKTAWLAAILVCLLGWWMVSKADDRKIIKKPWMLLVVVMGILSVLVSMYDNAGVKHDKKKLELISAEEEYIRIVYGGNTLYFSEFPKDDGVTYKIVDENGREPDLIWREKRGEIDSLDPRFEDLHFKVYLKDDISYAVFRCNDITFRFTDDLGTGKYEYISINGKPDDLVVAKTVFGTGDELINGRGYIWNRVLPIVLKNPIWGTGPDTFLQVFPQNDYVARSNLGYGFFSEILTNAHNFYLQIALQNGLVVLGCILILIVRYLKKGMEVYAHKETYNQLDKIGIACFLGSVGYLICGITFASSVCTTPFFVILVGTTIAIQKMKEKEL